MVKALQSAAWEKGLIGLLEVNQYGEKQSVSPCRSNGRPGATVVPGGFGGITWSFAIHLTNIAQILPNLVRNFNKGIDKRAERCLQ